MKRWTAILIGFHPWYVACRLCVGYPPDIRYSMGRGSLAGNKIRVAGTAEKRMAEGGFSASPTVVELRQPCMIGFEFLILEMAIKQKNPLTRFPN